MTPRSLDRSRPAALAAGAIALVGVGALGTYLAMAWRTAPPGAAPSAPPPPAAASAPSAAMTSVVVLSPDSLKRADLEIVAARQGSATGTLRVPATVAPDGYRQVLVTPASAGRVLAVSAEAGQTVRRGDVLARLHSPEVAETERAYLAARAELTVWELQLARLERLVAIGAASRQEQEAAQAQRVRLTTEMDSARARLLQLGRSPEAVAKLTTTDAVDPTVAILAPVGGTITRRLANPGQNVEADAELFTIVDLSAVWVVGDVYERDLARVRQGSAVTITSAALPGESRRGRVSYIDPQLAGETRTARVRVEVPNPGGRLRLGMFVEMSVDLPAADVVLVPRAAVQTVDRTEVVYVADPDRAGRFVERSVRVGDAVGSDVEILSGLDRGERVVARGSFLLRSERDRQNLAPPPPAPAVRSAGPDRPAAAEPPLTIKVSVGAAAFSPERIEIPAGQAVRLVFTRTAQDTCATEVLVPAVGARVALPLNKPVTVALPPQAPGTLNFACGMDMLRGQLIVK